MPLFNCKTELKLKWTNCCVLPAAGNGNDGIKLYVTVVTSSVRDNQKLSKLLRRGFERSVYWNEYKTKSENQNTTNEYR